MQTFKSFFDRKVCDSTFKDLYDCECNVCKYTVRIFECIDTRDIDMAHLAAEVGSDLAAVQALKDADACDPRLVIALCRHLGIDAPPACPKLQ